MAVLTALFRLGRDTELRYTPDGTAVANLALAYNYGKKENGQQPSQWVDASIFGKRAEALAEYLIKGTSIVELDHELHDLVHLVKHTGRGGEITIKLKVKPLTESASAVQIEDIVTIKAPALAKEKTVMFTTEAGELLREDPRQTKLELREVPRAAAPEAPKVLDATPREAPRAVSAGSLGLQMLDELRRDLRGKNLACWCPLDGPCHADVLLRVANVKDQPT